jgi:hypothetical protein
MKSSQTLYWVKSKWSFMILIYVSATWQISSAQNVSVPCGACDQRKQPFRVAHLISTKTVFDMWQVSSAHKMFSPCDISHQRSKCFRHVTHLISALNVSTTWHISSAHKIFPPRDTSHQRTKRFHHFTQLIRTITTLKNHLLYVSAMESVEDLGWD